MQMEEKKQSGYGFVSKDVLLDPEIPIEAKALYAYLCAHADKSGKCFPSVEGMCYHLNITEKRFRKYKTVLESQGIIEVKREKKGNCLRRNIYYIRDDLRSGSFEPIQNDRVDTDDSDGSEIGGSRNRRVGLGCVENSRINSTIPTAPIKQNQSDKKTSTNNICQQVCDLLNRRRSVLRSKGRVKSSEYGQLVIQGLLSDGVTEDAIIDRAKALSVSGTIEECDWYRFPNYFNKK